MLAKMWKKVLLAICIIACIFNLMLKLVNRSSLKENLDAANDGTTVFDIFKNKDIEVTESEQIINSDNQDTSQEILLDENNEEFEENIDEETINEENADEEIINEEDNEDEILIEENMNDEEF